MQNARTAVEAILGEPEKATKPAHDFMAHGLTAMLEAIDDQNFIPQVEKLIEETLELNIPALKRQFREPVTTENILPFVESALATISEDKARNYSRAMLAKVGFATVKRVTRLASCRRWWMRESTLHWSPMPFQV